MTRAESQTGRKQAAWELVQSCLTFLVSPALPVPSRLRMDRTKPRHVACRDKFLSNGNQPKRASQVSIKNNKLKHFMSLSPVGGWDIDGWGTMGVLHGES